MTKVRIQEIKDPKTYTKKGSSSMLYENTLSNAVHWQKKNALYIQIFPISPQRWFPKKDSVVKATLFFFFALVWYIENQSLLKQLVNGRDAIGGAVRGEIEMSMWLSCLVWTATESVENVTADLTALQRVRQEHSTSIKNQPNKKPKNKLQLRQLVNKEKHFTDSKFKGSKRL